MKTEKQTSKPKITPEGQLESDKKHIRLIALGWGALSITEQFVLEKFDEGNKRKKLYSDYIIANDREATIYALKHGIITQAEAEATLAPYTVYVDWALVKDIE